MLNGGRSSAPSWAKLERSRSAITWTWEGIKILTCAQRRGRSHHRHFIFVSLAGCVQSLAFNGWFKRSSDAVSMEITLVPETYQDGTIILGRVIWHLALFPQSGTTLSDGISSVFYSPAYRSLGRNCHGIHIAHYFEILIPSFASLYLSRVAYLVDT